MSIGPYGRQFDHLIKYLVSIKTSANPSLSFPTLPYPILLDAATQPWPTLSERIVVSDKTFLQFERLNRLSERVHENDWL